MMVCCNVSHLIPYSTDADLDLQPTPGLIITFPVRVFRGWMHKWHCGCTWMHPAILAISGCFRGSQYTKIIYIWLSDLALCCFYCCLRKSWPRVNLIEISAFGAPTTFLPYLPQYLSVSLDFRLVPYRLSCPRCCALSKSKTTAIYIW